METDFQPGPASGLDAGLLARLQDWTGRREDGTDDVTAAPLAALSATLDRDDAAPAHGSAVPPLWHWLFFLPRARQSQIGPDGHPIRGGFLPPVPLPRRMWAASRIRWEVANPLVVGDSVRRVSTIASITHKRGRTGDLVFVRVNHALHNARGLALTEDHDIVYRPPVRPDETQPPADAAPANARWSRTVVPDDVLLFRYSALTFNGHRIHYDRSYATEVEGYPGLVVHGPLIATLLVDLVRREMPGAQISGFEFKAIRPTFDLHPFAVHGRPCEDGRNVDVWAADHEGFLTMQARVTLA